MTTYLEQWDFFEAALGGPAEGNPFTDVTFGACFVHKHRVVEVDGFYDGAGTYRVRFMPDTPGEWRYTTVSNRAELDGQTGAFTCVDPGPDNHGPVGVHNTFHFAYADGTPYMQIGTPCYAWAHQGADLEAQTLATLAQAPFNKLRMCVFPKDYAYNKNEPEHYVYQRQDDGSWDFTRFNPAFFHHFEALLDRLRALNIEADLILFHPYDRWGFADMGAENDDRYLRYVVARLAAYRNVWWSMANEFDLMQAKSEADWDRFFRIVQTEDPYQHPRSIHNCRSFYDHAKPWVTHASIQHNDVDRAGEWRATYGKPVVIDECKYEGNIQQQWGNISAREMVHRFWLGTVNSGYVGHGETYLHPDDILWWSKGGVLHGDSAPRLAFLRRILEESGAGGLDPIRRWGAGVEGRYYLYYTGVAQPGEWKLDLPAGTYTVDLIDPWAMTVTRLDGTFQGTSTVPLPSQAYMAFRVQAT
ncbi:MAG: DUF5060 domain-containing protein [Caldilineaceae bacterium]